MHSCGSSSSFFLSSRLTVRHKQLHLKIAVQQRSRLLLALRGKMARWRFCWERRDEFVEQQHRAHHPWKNHDAEEEEKNLTFKTKVVFCMSTMKLLNKTFKVLLWSDAHRSDKWNNSQTTVTSRCFVSKAVLFFNYTTNVSQKLEYFIDQNLMCARSRFWVLLLHQIKCAWILKRQSWDLFH